LKTGTFVSDLNVIGFTFQRCSGSKKRTAIAIDNNIIHGGEHQINDGIKMMHKGMKFVPGKVDEWMDCGNKEVTVPTIEC
jgi:glucose-1-phosphate thymidylyltransferase